MFIDVATFGVQADASAKCLSKSRAVALGPAASCGEWTATAPRYSRLHIVGHVQIRGRPNDEQPHTRGPHQTMTRPAPELATQHRRPSPLVLTQA